MKHFRKISWAAEAIKIACVLWAVCAVAALNGTMSLARIGCCFLCAVCSVLCGAVGLMVEEAELAPKHKKAPHRGEAGARKKKITLLLFYSERKGLSNESL